MNDQSESDWYPKMHFNDSNGVSSACHEGRCYVGQEFVWAARRPFSDTWHAIDNHFA